MDRRQVVNVVIVDLLQVGSIYQYLASHWWNKDITVNVWENDKRKHPWKIVNITMVDKVYHYLLENWSKHKVKITIWEREKVECPT